MTMGVRAVLVVPVMLVAGLAMGQATGVSHPEQVMVTTSPEGIAQPVVYEKAATAQTSEPVYVPTPSPVLKDHAAVAERVVEASAGDPVGVEEQADTADLAYQSDRPRKLVTDPDAGIVARVAGASNELPKGTLLKIFLRESLSTSKTTAGTAFTADLAQAVVRDGRVLLPPGSVVSGVVSDVHGGRRVQGSASMHLEPRSVTLPDGTSYDLKAEVIDTGLFRNDRVDKEGTIFRKDHAKGTVAVVALATGSGAAAGAVFGGWPGAVVGGAVGLGVSGFLWLKQDRQAEFGVGTEMDLMLTRSIFVGGVARGSAGE